MIAINASAKQDPIRPLSFKKQFNMCSNLALILFIICAFDYFVLKYKICLKRLTKVSISGILALESLLKGLEGLKIISLNFRYFFFQSIIIFSISLKM